MRDILPDEVDLRDAAVREIVAVFPATAAAVARLVLSDVTVPFCARRPHLPAWPPRWGPRVEPACLSMSASASPPLGAGASLSQLRARCQRPDHGRRCVALRTGL